MNLCLKYIHNSKQTPMTEMAIFSLKQIVDFRNQDTPVFMCFPHAEKGIW